MSQFLEKFGGYSLFLIALAVLGWFGLYFLAPMASSVEIVASWDSWLGRVANNWQWVIIGCVAIAAFAAVMELAEEKEGGS